MQGCEQAMAVMLASADPSLRWHDPDQVQGFGLRHLSPHGTPSVALCYTTFTF